MQPDNDRTPAEYPAPDDAADQVRRGAEHLSQIARQMEAFLEQQLARIEEFALAANGLDQNAAAELARLQEQFQHQRSQWEQERDEERERLLEESQRLVKAWKDLEAEQREAMKQQALSGQLGRYATSKADGKAAATAAKEVAQTTAPVAPANGAPPTSRQGPAQFQQLRREMLEHARQRRKR